MQVQPGKAPGSAGTQGRPGWLSFLPLLGCLQAASLPAPGSLRRGSGRRGMLRTREGTSRARETRTALGSAGAGAGLAPAGAALDAVGTAVPRLLCICNPRASCYMCSRVEQSTVLLKMMKQSQMTHFLRYRKFLALLQVLKAVIIR